MKQKALSNLILAAYVLMMIVSLVSAVDLFKISHPNMMFGWIMSIAIEISIATLLMINRSYPAIKSAIYALGFITFFQICANTYSAYIHIDSISSFAELFALDEWEAIDQKRILAFATGGVLPAICLALIYIQNETRELTDRGSGPLEETLEDENNGHDGPPAGSEAGSDPDGNGPEETNESEVVIETKHEDVIEEAPKDSQTISSEPVDNEPVITDDVLPHNVQGEPSEGNYEPKVSQKRKYVKKNAATHKGNKKVARSVAKGKKTKSASKTSIKSIGTKKAKTSKAIGENREESLIGVPEAESISNESVAELAETLNNNMRGKNLNTMNSFHSLF